MKKTYETPSIEVVKFKYRDQVVAQSTPGGTICEYERIHEYDNCSETGVDWISVPA